MPVFRFAEVLLIAAEGLARTGHEDNAVGGAKYYLNQVRKRAGLMDETATGDNLVQAKQSIFRNGSGSCASIRLVLNLSR